MAKFPTHEEMAKNVAEKALDDFLYNGKSIREWIQIITSEDCISRKAVLALAKEECDTAIIPYRKFVKDINALPSVASAQKEEHISETSMHHFVCAFCDNDKCVRGTKECEFEQWKAKESEKENENMR